MDKKIVCLGDSLTFGSVGYSYIRFLRHPLEVINKGVNGDTTYGALKRLRRIVAYPEYEAADTYIVGIGTNDVLLPYLTRISWLWKLQMEPRCRRLQCKTDMKEFAVEYEKYLILLADRQKKMILIGMPYIELKGYPHESIRIRNKIIGRLAKKYEVPFIDIYALQMELASQPGEYTWKHRNLTRLTEGIFMAVLPFTKDWFGRMRGLKLTVDGVHYNTASAKALAGEVQRRLDELEKERNH